MRNPQEKRLVHIDPLKVVFDATVLVPSMWDGSVVQQDLDRFVQMSRRIVNALPTIALLPPRVVAIDGWPFLLAAQSAIPPIHDVVCRTVANDSEFRRMGLKEVNVADLRCEIEPPYHALTLISFRLQVSERDSRRIEDLVARFIDTQLRERVLPQGPDVNWFDDHLRLAIRLWRDDSDRMIWLLHELERLVNEVSAVRSVNGMAPTACELAD